MTQVSPSVVFQESHATPPSNPHPHYVKTKPNKKLLRDYHFPRLPCRASSTRGKNSISTCLSLNTTRTKPAAAIQWQQRPYSTTRCKARVGEKLPRKLLRSGSICEQFASGLLKSKGFGNTAWVAMLISGVAFILRVNCEVMALSDFKAL